LGEGMPVDCNDHTYKNTDETGTNHGMTALKKKVRVNFLDGELTDVQVTHAVSLRLTRRMCSRPPKGQSGVMPPQSKWNESPSVSIVR